MEFYLSKLASSPISDCMHVHHQLRQTPEFLRHTSTEQWLFMWFKMLDTPGKWQSTACDMYQRECAVVLHILQKHCGRAPS